ncbi:hypothetical protein [Pseudonocardia sp. T1-2H]|uniref:hypothetical protein n=1 Tax=Pseudonocardia sp. T1-2H TaxID=3128899 RepID=UPI003100C0DD
MHTVGETPCRAVGVPDRVGEHRPGAVYGTFTSSSSNGFTATVTPTNTASRVSRHPVTAVKPSR